MAGRLGTTAASGTRSVLAVIAALVFVGDGIAAVAVTGHGGSRRPAPIATAPVPVTTASPETVLAPGQAIVSGTVASAHIEGAVGGLLRLPVTVTIPDRGEGHLNIERVVFEGAAGATVAWDGGQPLPLSGTGALDLGAATLDANAGGVTWHLDGAPRLLDPGRYTAGSSVAVGVAGLAEPLDQATFSVAPGSQGVLVSVGDAQVHRPPGAVHVTGPGLVELLGMLSVRTSTGVRIARNLHVGPGPLDLRLAPSAGGYTVVGLLEGPISLLQ